MNSKQQGSRTGRSFKKPAATIVAVAALGTGLALLGTTGASADTSVAASCNLLSVGVTGLTEKAPVKEVSHVEVVTPATDVKVIDSPAIPGVEEVSHIVHHDAVYKTVIVLDHDAYDEKIIDQAYVPGTPAVEEVSHIVHHEAVTHEEQKLVKEAYDEKVIDVPGKPEVAEVSHIVHHEAEYKTVVDVPEHTEQKLVKAAYDEKVIDQAYVPGVPAVKEVSHTEYEWYNLINGKSQWLKDGLTPTGKGWVRTGDCKKVIDVPGKAAIPAIPEKSHIVKHPAVYETVTVPAVTHQELVKAAYDEKVIDQAYVPAVEEVSHTVHHEAEYETITVTDKDAYDEKVIDVAAQDAVPEVPEVSHVVHHNIVTHEEAVLVTAAYDEKVIDVKGVDAIPEVSHIVHTDAVTKVVIDTPAEEGDTQPNNVTVSVDGKTEAQVDFGTAWNGSYNLDGTKNHTYVVTVQSWDGADDVQKGSTQACVTTPGQVTPPKDGGGTGTTVVTPSKPVIAAVPLVKTPVAPAQAAEPENTGATLAYTGSEGLEQGGLAALALLGLGGGALWLGRRAKHRA